MKAFVFIFLFPILLLSCREEDGIDFSEKSRNETRFVFQVSSEIQTRAEGTTFDAGDKIGIYVVRHLPGDTPVLESSGNYADNKCYEVVNGTSLEPATDNDVICASGTEYVYTIYAYYPYNDTISDPTNIYGEVELDQTYGTNFKKSDFMMAQTTCLAAGIPINLNFERKLSCLEVVYDKIDGVVPCTLALYGTWSEYIVNLQTGILQKTGDHFFVNAFFKYAETDAQCVYRMIVPPHNLENGGFFQVDMDGELNYYYIDSFPLQPGALHTFYLTGQKRHISYSVFLNGDAGGTVSGMGAEFVLRGDIDIAEGQQCRVSAKPNAGYLFSGWFKNGVRVSEEPEYTFMVTEDVHLEAHFHQERIKITITCYPSREVLAPCYPYYNPEMNYDYGEEVTLYGNIITDSPYTFDGWYENGRYLNRDYEYCFTAIQDRHLIAKYGLKVLGNGSSVGMGILNQPGYFTKSTIHDGKPEYLEKGQRVHITGGATYQTYINEYSTPIIITDRKLYIKSDDLVVWEGEDFEDFIFTVPQSGNYSLHSSMSVRGYLEEGERIGLTLLLSHFCWIVP